MHSGHGEPSVSRLRICCELSRMRAASLLATLCVACPIVACAFCPPAGLAGRSVKAARNCGRPGGTQALARMGLRAEDVAVEGCRGRAGAQASAQAPQLEGGVRAVLSRGARLLFSALLPALVLAQQPVLLPPPVAHAAGSEESRVVAEAWKVLDRAYVDPTFNGQDWRGVRREYVRPNYKGTKEAYEAVSEMCKKLGDKYTRFLTPAQYKTLQNMYTVKEPPAGVGVEVYIDPGTGSLTVLSTVPDSPSQRAGVVRGDAILKVNGEAVGGKAGTADDAAVLLRGEEGGKVTLTISPALGGEPKEVALTREKIKAKPVTWSVKDFGGKKIGAIKVPTFAQTTVSDVAGAVAAVEKEGAQALVLDVRGNVGGSFPSGVDLAKTLLGADQTVVFVVGREGPPQEYRTEQDGESAKVPLAVLVDGNTASAAEVFAAALQDNGRAKLVGEKTFGKGLVQTIAKLQDGSALVVTVAKYETPKHTDINKKGITPDVAVTCPMDKDVECLPDNAL